MPQPHRTHGSAMLQCLMLQEPACFGFSGTLFLAGCREVTLKPEHPSAPIGTAFKRRLTPVLVARLPLLWLSNRQNTSLSPCSPQREVACGSFPFASLSHQSQTTQQLCSIQNDVALRSHTLNLTRAGETQQSYGTFGASTSSQDSAGYKGHGFTLGLGYKSSAGIRNSTG